MRQYVKRPVVDVSVLDTDEEGETAQTSSSGSRFPINKDDAITIAIALAVSTLVRTYVSSMGLPCQFPVLLKKLLAAATCW